jgi:hypothetical protein
MTQQLKNKIWSRFWSKVDATNTCWLWTASVHHTPLQWMHKGDFPYGRFGIGPEVFKAHRVAYELVVGPIPQGLWVLHKCDNPRCVRPSHLFLGNHATNMADVAAKKRAPHGTNHQYAKLTNADVKSIRKMRTQGVKNKDIAKYFGICEATASTTARCLAWTHVK